MTLSTGPGASWKHVYYRVAPEHAQTILNERQIKVLNKLLDAGPEGFEGGMTTREYVSLTGVSKATATRELADLLAKGCLEKQPGGGRSTSYGVR